MLVMLEDTPLSLQGLLYDVFKASLQHTANSNYYYHNHNHSDTSHNESFIMNRINKLFIRKEIEGDIVWENYLHLLSSSASLPQPPKNHQTANKKELMEKIQRIECCAKSSANGRLLLTYFSIESILHSAISDIQSMEYNQV